jgi:FkbH-like protein
MNRSLSHSLTDLGQMLLGLVYFCLTPIYATTALALMLHGLVYDLGLGENVTWVEWVIAAPLVYVAWLNSFLIACAIDIQVWRLIFRYEKPRRAVTTDSHRSYQLVFLTVALYMREYIVWSLPLTQAYMFVPWLRNLVLLASAHRTCLGWNCQVMGILYDPDLTEIGDGALIGARCSLTAHSVTTTPEGAFVLVTAPIVIGPRAVVGGESRVGLGARIGADAIVEPASNVAAFTVIGDGEIWGGNPAQFIRKRFEPSVTESIPTHVVDSPDATRSPARATHDDSDDALRHVVAMALDLPLDAVSDDLDSKSCAAWDSLGQLGIAAGLHDRFGITLSADESFRLRSMHDLRQVLRSARTGVASATDSASASGSTACVEAIELPTDPELLPLLDHETVTRLLASHDATGTLDSGEVGPLSVVIAATFTAEPVASSLKLWSAAFGVPVRVEFAGYNQVPQELLGSASLFRQNTTGLNVVLTRPEDLLNNPCAAGAGLADSLLDAIERFARDANGTLVVATLPPLVSQFTTADRSAVETLRARWRQRLSEFDGVELVDFSDVVEQIGIAAAGRSDLEAVARSPYSPKVYQELGIVLARLVRRRRVAPAKVLALDADGVLWGGVLAEDGHDGIQIGPDHPGRSFQLFQQQILQLKQRGVLLVLVSRNVEEDVFRVLDEHPGMLLRREDITAARINWRPKSENLRELAAELGLGLDSFVFVDDDMANRLEVGQHAPQVTVLPLPANPALYCQTLSQLWRFDTPRVTDEDRLRSVMMRQEQQRQHERESTGDLESYLHSLQIRVRMREAGPADLPRVAQLTQKTNQFNLSLRRRNLTEIKALGPRSTIYVVEASDKFGDYGLVGVAILIADESQLDHVELDTLLMSCRALGRGVEEATLHGLASAATTHGGRWLIAPFVTGPRNQPALAFLQRSGWSEQPGSLFTLDATQPIPLPSHVTWIGPDDGVVRKAG